MAPNSGGSLYRVTQSPLGRAHCIQIYIQPLLDGAHYIQPPPGGNPCIWIYIYIQPPVGVAHYIQMYTVHRPLTYTAITRRCSLHSYTVTTRGSSLYTDLYNSY
ncbi:hypothetical protein GDO78_019502 [Eleutherodactylus coqui]|uniref:Uncharacterized protein n=1 Tax=Eleutherodactylus coqui TaxID=57060 RepID=A0A8J6EQZ1_ELECQ|nr:hypothetical protein GDO78_019502 [Eleutherodactylus coqui]